MRTTIELTAEQRAELLRLAAERGLKGFSPLIREALEDYLRRASEKADSVAAALELQGAFRGREAEEFAARTEALREHWR